MNTIAAISTGNSPGGIGVIRISGENAFKIADAVFRASSGKKAAELEGYRALFGKVFDEDGEFDEAVLLVFRAPHSYTGENIAEISVHGGLFNQRRTLEAVLKQGAVRAAAGEFTKRAFVNGKIDLTKAEGVAGIINAQGKRAEQLSFSALSGKLGSKISEIRKPLVRASAALAAWVDFPDDEISELSENELAEIIKNAEKSLSVLLKNRESGRVFTEGVRTAILGKPNAGKSTLMNALSGFDRSIVSEIAGTTRDEITEKVSLGGIVLSLTDTAGLRETSDEIERIGVDRAMKNAENSDLILAVFDGARELSEEDERLFELCREKPCIALVNKSDLTQKIDKKRLEAEFSKVVEISAEKETGIETLEKAVLAVLNAAEIDTNEGNLINDRQYDCVKRAVELLKRANEALLCGTTLDAVNVLLDDAVAELLVLTGEKASDAVVSEIFSAFCVGK
ncbi:MAG: tRNA uridine-5-carboxymethylaminomethyl(34) synthesis GTPase MnmE [Candidatus Fimenecus sp.]